MPADKTPEYRALEREIKLAERAYNKALTSRRGDGLGETGALLRRLYDRQRKLRTGSRS